MRYQPAHAAKSGSVPFMLRGPKSVRTILSAAVAGIVGLVPTVLIASPAHAATGDYTIADASVTEGGTLTFTITRAPAGVADPLPAETLNWSTSDGSATAGQDYTAVTTTPTTGTITFPAYTNTSVPQSRTITVQTLQDTVDEVDAETLTVTLADPGTNDNPLTLTDDNATGTIEDDDNPTFTLTSSPTTVNESLAVGARKATITATLSKASPFDVTIPISTADGTAKAPQDYVALDDAITITAGQTTGSVTVQVEDDAIDEPAVQSFTVNTTAGTNVTGTQTVTVNIADDDAAPVISIASGGTVQEGGTLTFNATLSGLSENTVTARWDTADGAAGTPTPGNGTATAGSDYTATSNGTVTFEPLSSAPTTPITVKTNLDDIDEATEDLQVKLSQPTNATIGVPTAVTGSIQDSGTTPGPQVTLTPTTVTEGSATTSRARTFTVKLSKASGREQKVQYVVAAGTADPGAGIGVATAGQDFVATGAPGVLTFAAGETEKTFTVDVMGDNVDEGNGENMAITLSDTGGGLAAGLSLGANQVTITDDDDKPVISLSKSDMTMPEGDGPSAALFEIKLSNPSSEDVDWTATPASNPAGTATLGDDFTALTPLSGTFTAGQTSAYILFVVNGDEVYEPTETVRYTVARDVGEEDATGGPLTANLTITNDDDAPDLEITSATAQEGDTLSLQGIVTGSSQTDTVLNVTLTGKSMGGKQAASANDFTPTAFPVTIPGGTASGTSITVGNVVIADDTTPEPDETIVVNGTGFAGTGTVTDGVITIAASDGGSTQPTDITLSSAASYRLGVGSLRLSGTAAAGAELTLWGKPIGAPGDKEWESLGTTTANSNGGYAFFPRFTTTGWWFRVSGGDTESNAIKVYLKEDPDFYTRSYSRGTATLIVYGDPRIAGLSVRFLRANSNGTWSTVGTGVLDANGKFSKTLTGLRSGASYLYKATIYGDGDVGLMTNTSVSSRIRVR
ncbi:Calx-beta domain-containing protein [Actinoplanes sp. NPDC049316]|uniref:beta strand repeat-containing protein n=1 Tax=Actinoplanes sp. NPDC049316 TaxID=3154727 RepID=UPI0034417310